MSVECVIEALVDYNGTSCGDTPCLRGFVVFQVSFQVTLPRRLPFFARGEGTEDRGRLCVTAMRMLGV